jgi:hypothetical protein
LVVKLCPVYCSNSGYPEPFTTGPMRVLPILLIFLAMFYWLWRVRRRRPLPVVVRHDLMPRATSAE